MDTQFWIQKWEKNEIAFHGSETNPLLLKYFNELSLTKGSRVFLPLCGKTLDIAWLLSEGCRVAGAELSQLAITQLFAELGIKPSISQVGALKRYQGKNIDIFVGNLFDLSKEILGPVDAVYDRAALVALPEETRKQYTAHLRVIAKTAKQLLLTYEYDQSVREGPPFSISNEEVHQHYKDSYTIKLLESVAVAGGLKGEYPATEHVWLLEKV